MKNEKLYVTLAQLVGAFKRCEADGDKRDWVNKHRDRARVLVKRYLPSGAGYDSGTKLDFEASTEKKLVFSTAFHHMNENGYYDGWTQHEVIVTPSLAFGFRLRITGHNRNDIKDVIARDFDAALHTVVEEPRDDAVAVAN